MLLSAGARRHAVLAARLQPRTQPHRGAVAHDEAPLAGGTLPHQGSAGTRHQAYL